VLFTAIVSTLHRTARQRRANAKSQRQQSQQQKARAVVSVSALLGLAWLFAALINTGNVESSLVFQYLFAVFATLQGFAIFLLQCVYSDSVREAAQNSAFGSRRTYSSTGKLTTLPKPRKAGSTKSTGGNTASSGNGPFLPLEVHSSNWTGVTEVTAKDEYAIAPTGSLIYCDVDLSLSDISVFLGEPENNARSVESKSHPATDSGACHAYEQALAYDWLQELVAAEPACLDSPTFLTSTVFQVSTP
jgi:hypothetical protein